MRMISPNPSHLISGVAWWDFFCLSRDGPVSSSPGEIAKSTDILSSCLGEVSKATVVGLWNQSTAEKSTTNPFISRSLQVNQLIYATRWDTKIGLGHTMDFIYSWINLRSNLSVSRGRHVVCLIVLSIQVMYEVWPFWVNKCIYI